MTPWDIAISQLSKVIIRPKTLKISDNEKMCSQCLQIKPLDNFPLRDTRTNQRRSYCKQCAKDYKRKWDTETKLGTRKVEQRLCANEKCGRLFTPLSNNSKSCSTACSNVVHSIKKRERMKAT